MKPIHVVLSPNFSDWEIATLTGVGRAFYGAEIIYSAAKAGPVASAGRLAIRDLPAFEAPRNAVVVVCGGPAFESDPAPGVEAALRTSYEQDCIVAGICGGTLALARAGLLDKVRHTSNGPDYIKQHVPSYLGAAMYVDRPIAVRDGSIVTAPAPAPASFAAEVLVAAGLEADKAAEIRSMLGREHTASALT